MQKMTLFTGNANPKLARDVSLFLDVQLGKADVGNFSDGEVNVDILENVRGRDCFVLQSTCAPANSHLMELLVMIDALKRASARRITAVIPYYGYARQDRKAKPRAPITAKLVANLLVAAGANRILTMDLHAQQIQGFFDIPVDHLYASPVIFTYLKYAKKDDQVVVSPDVGGLKMAHAYSEMLGADLAIVAKRRTSATDTESMGIIGDIEGKNALLVDDLTETAGTLVNAAAILKERGAVSVRACVSHTILNDLGIDRLKNSCIDELITTDTVPRPEIEGLNINTLSVAGLLGEAIQRIHNNSSVNSLFRFKGARTT
jgi:ribose-phosphate pyrophosphokinase